MWFIWYMTGTLWMLFDKAMTAYMADMKNWDRNIWHCWHKLGYYVRVVMSIVRWGTFMSRTAWNCSVSGYQTHPETLTQIWKNKFKNVGVSL